MDQVLSNLRYIGLGLYLIFILRFLFLVFKACNDIYLYDYEHAPEPWDRDGNLGGIQYWKIPKQPWKDSYRLSARRSGAVTAMLWIFVTPKWAEDHPEAQKQVVNLCTNVLWWSIGVTISFCLIVFT